MAGDAEFNALLNLWENAIIGGKVVSVNRNLASMELEVVFDNGRMLPYPIPKALLDVHVA
jgi:hypothetical protein